MIDYSKLTVKQENFCNYYVELGNASEAYRRAFSAENMKTETINRKAVELLAKDKLAARVQDLRNDLQKRSDLKKDDAVKELTNIVRARITDIIQVSENTVMVKDLNVLPDEVVSAISSIKQTSTGLEVKLYDKISAIEKLSKMLGWDTMDKAAENISKMFAGHTVIFKEFGEKDA